MLTYSLEVVQGTVVHAAITCTKSAPDIGKIIQPSMQAMEWSGGAWVGLGERLKFKVPKWNQPVSKTPLPCY